MNATPRFERILLIAFAVCLLLGLTLTPPAGDGAASLLESLRAHQARANVTGVFRGLTSILVVPALAAISPAISSRGQRIVRPAAVCLYLGNMAGVVVVTHMAFQNNVLAPAPDQTTALAMAEALESGALWWIAAVTYLFGLALGFLLLGVAVWRAGLGRLLALAIGAGFLVHVAVGDWVVTSWGGALILALGLIGLALRLGKQPDGARASAVPEPERSAADGA